MRWLILLVVILFLSNLLSAQDFAKNFNLYELGKKDMAVGYLWSSIIPGGGLFYCERFGPGLSLLGGEIAFYFLASKHYVFLVLVKLFEFYLVTEAIDDYNEDLRKRLNLAIDFKNNYQGLKLSYTF